MDEYEFVSNINIIAESNGCRTIGIDFQAKLINIEGPEENQARCAIAISNFMAQCCEVKEVKTGMQQLTEGIGWIT